MMNKGVLERYEKTGEFYCGGFGKVDKCRDIHLDRYVAIKSYLQGVEDSKDRLSDEISSLLKMRSNHVVQVYDVLTNHNEYGSLSLVMEFLEGESISLPSDMPNILKLLWQIASGISDIHAATLIHRDIKLSNMKMDKDGIVKIFDFGLTKTGIVNAHSQNLLGTYGYAAPELYMTGESFSQAIDVYAFAFLVLELFGLEKSTPELLTNPPTFPINNPYENTTLKECPELIEMLYKGLSTNPLDRPVMDNFKKLFEQYLLRWRHRATLIYNSKIYYLSQDQRRLELNFGRVGGCIIEYDGDKFVMKNVSGYVYVNNDRVNKDLILEGAYVITLGENSSRTHLPFNTSNPEVVI